jgi:hypothetical protein
MLLKYVNISNWANIYFRKLPNVNETHYFLSWPASEPPLDEINPLYKQTLKFNTYKRRIILFTISFATYTLFNLLRVVATGMKVSNNMLGI